jgi:AcrR family transcriptional regulator
MLEMPEDLDARRTAVLEAAARLYVEDGPHGLSMRKVSAAAGGSTQLMYTLFGGKHGLADALYTEAYDRLARHMDEAGFEDVPPGDPGRLKCTQAGYRNFATKEPGFFSLMFGRVVPDFRPSAEARAAGRAKTFGRVVEAAQACLDAGTLKGDDALLLAGTCWAATHGLASLEANEVVGVGDAILDRHQADKLAARLQELILAAHQP